MSYIGFEKEDAAKQVNWSSVTAGFAKNISGAISTREKRKKAIDDKIASDLLKIADTKQGKHQGVNEAQANLANQYTSMMLENQKNLKNGNLSVREWTTMQNNAMSGANAIYGAIETLNTQYDTMLKGYDEGTISGAAVQLWEGYSTLLDTNNQALYVEPTTGKTFVGSLDKNGNIDMGTLNTVETVLGALQQDYPAFDMNKFLEGEVESIAEFSVYANEPDGKYGKKINSPKIANSYKNWKTNVINEALTRPKNTLSILVDNKQGYKLTTNKQEWENDKTGLLIYHQQTDDNSGIVDFQFTDAQIDAAKALLDHDIEMSIGYKEEADNRQDRNKKTELENATLGYFKNVDNLISGDAKNFDATATNIIKSFENQPAGTNRPTKIDRQGDEITITMNDGRNNITSETFSLTPEEGGTQENVAQKIWEFVTPGGTSFSEGLALFNETEGGFTPRMIDDGQGNMIPNPNYRSSETSSASAPFQEIPLSLANPTQVNILGEDGKITTVAQVLSNVKWKDEQQSINAVKNALSSMTKGTGATIDVSFVDQWGGDNILIIEVDGKKREIEGTWGKWDQNEVTRAIQLLSRKAIEKHNKKGVNSQSTATTNTDTSIYNNPQ